MVDENKLKKALKLYLVTDSDILKGRDFYKVIEDSMKAGVTMVQLREKDADGIHVGQSDIDAVSVRKLIGEDKIIGVSARSVEEAKKAKEDGANYLGIGAMFSTSTKLDAKDVSFDTLNNIINEVDLPFVLIGGINLDNVCQLKQFNPDGYALVSGILGAQDIKSRIKSWYEKI